jgi:hypothetical protein
MRGIPSPARGASRAACTLVMQRGRLGIEIITSDGFQGSIEAPHEVAFRAIAIGTAGDVLVDSCEGFVGPEHLLVHVDEYGRVLVSSGYHEAPAFTEYGAIPADIWVELPMPCHVLLGDTVIALFWFIPRSRDRARFLTTEKLVRKPTPFFARLRARLRRFAA